MFALLVVLCLTFGQVNALRSPSRGRSVAMSSSVFTQTKSRDRSTLKLQILQLGAALDRGQAYNPTSGSYYEDRMEAARERVQALVKLGSPTRTLTLAQLDGEWELVFSTVKNGIFRSSPFFLAIQEAFARGGEPDKANLFFKLHELQVLSWGVSKVGRVAQTIDAKAGVLTSEFDTSLFSLTVIPILGWGKLLPTFGGCVQTVSSVRLVGDVLDMEVDYTTAKAVEGLGTVPGTVGKVVPVKQLWNLLPWNKAGPVCSVRVVYADNDFRIVEDADGELFVYTRPVVPRP